MRSGEPLAGVLEELEELAVELVLVVSDRATEITAALEPTRRLTRLPIGGLLSSAVDPVDLSGEWLERGAVVIGLLEGATPDRLGPMRAVLEGRTTALAAAAKERVSTWTAMVASAAERAPGGDALWVGSPEPDPEPPGFRWTHAQLDELPRFAPDRFRLVVSPDPRPSLAALGALLERGGWLLARTPLEASDLRPDGMDLRELSVDASGRLVLARRR
jgi:hypothetical protein